MSLLEPSINASKQYQLPYLAIAYNAGYHLKKKRRRRRRKKQALYISVAHLSLA
jgi:hypothetical protein